MVARFLTIGLTPTLTRTLTLTGTLTPTLTLTLTLTGTLTPTLTLTLTLTLTQVTLYSLVSSPRPGYHSNARKAEAVEREDDADEGKVVTLKEMREEHNHAPWENKGWPLCVAKECWEGSSSSNLTETESSVSLLSNTIAEIHPSSVMALYPTTVSMSSASCIPAPRRSLGCHVSLASISHGGIQYLNSYT